MKMTSPPQRAEPGGMRVSTSTSSPTASSCSLLRGSCTSLQAGERGGTVAVSSGKWDHLACGRWSPPCDKELFYNVGRGGIGVGWSEVVQVRAR